MDMSVLSPFQRILLTTDGTVTDMLEAFLAEPIQLIKLSEAFIEMDRAIEPMNIESGTKVIERKILLQGKTSQKNYIYARSLIVLDRLEENFRQELLQSKVPIGKIWLAQKVETFKEIIQTGKETAKGLSRHFDIKPTDNVLFRTYCVSSNQKPTIMITEKFPESYFRN